ncbi:MAG TPA: hypothetical protein VNJ54_11395, partial [Plantibacter sp.]|uniref:hypothetical protein n=1 Tax=Plantibacter sp. TaxID=1871045 RepID=UPI002C182A1F|nr:hypothetical protein [Plantibacter sp.]
TLNLTPPNPQPPQPPTEENTPMFIVKHNGRVYVGNGVNAVTYPDGDKAIAFAITRAIRSGQPLRSDDGSKIVKVNSIAHVLEVSDSAARSLGRTPA